MIDQNVLIYGSSDVAVLDDGTLVKNLFGFYKLANTAHGLVYLQMLPNYFEDPLVAYPRTHTGLWYFIHHSLFQDFETFQEVYLDDNNTPVSIFAMTGVSFFFI